MRKISEANKLNTISGITNDKVAHENSQNWGQGGRSPSPQNGTTLTGLSNTRKHPVYCKDKCAFLCEWAQFTSAGGRAQRGKTIQYVPFIPRNVIMATSSVLYVDTGTLVDMGTNVTLRLDSLNFRITAVEDTLTTSPFKRLWPRLDVRHYSRKEFSHWKSVSWSWATLFQKSLDGRCVPTLNFDPLLDFVQIFVLFMLSLKLQSLWLHSLSLSYGNSWYWTYKTWFSHGVSFPSFSISITCVCNLNIKRSPEGRTPQNKSG